MTNPRQEDKSAQGAEETFRRTSERAAEQASRIGQKAAEAGQEVARAGADLLQKNAETLQNAWRFGCLDMATAVVGRSTDQLGRALGLSGSEAQQATELSAQNAETILYSATAVTKGMSRVPRSTSNSRGTVESVLESSRRMADMSLKLADDTARHITENMERIKRAA